MRRVLILLSLITIGCRRHGEETDTATPAEHPDDHAGAAAEHAMAGTMPEDLHMRLTTVRAPSRADSARAAQTLAVMRRDLAGYRDIRVAEGDGFRQYIPAGGAPIQHYTKLRWSFQARNALNPSRPTSLLYQRAANGNLELVGAMFTAPAHVEEDELDARLPLSMVRWHQHINWCLPPLADARRRWRETRNGQPVFGPKSPIATAAACEAVGGRFRPRLFGWMVHVMAFSGDDPWNAHAGEGHHH
jgi:hypothetical protein